MWFNFDNPRKKAKQNKTKRKWKETNAVQVLTNISIAWIKFMMDRQVLR